MLDVLEEAVAGLEVQPSCRELEQLFSLIDRLQAKASSVFAMFDAEGAWVDDGATSGTAWLRHHARLGSAEAGSVGRTAKRLLSLDVTRAAWHDGRIARGHVHAITANLSVRTAPFFVEQEADRIRDLSTLSVKDAVQYMHQWRLRAEAMLDDDPDTDEQPSELHHNATFQGRWETKASWNPFDGTILDHAMKLRLSLDDRGAEDPRSFAQRRADALRDICRHYLDTAAVPPARRNRPHVTVVISHDDLANGGPGRTLDGCPLAHSSVRELLCGATFNRLVVDGSTIIDQGRDQRLFTTSQFRAIATRDRHCRLAGCDRPPAWCEAHHVVPYPHGPTSLDNGVLLCDRHHHVIHKRGWELKLEADGTLHATTPTGATWTTRPLPIARC